MGEIQSRLTLKQLQIITMSQLFIKSGEASVSLNHIIPNSLRHHFQLRFPLYFQTSFEPLNQNLINFDLNEKVADYIIMNHLGNPLIIRKLASEETSISDLLLEFAYPPFINSNCRVLSDKFTQLRIYERKVGTCGWENYILTEVITRVANTLVRDRISHFRFLKEEDTSWRRVKEIDFRLTKIDELYYNLINFVSVKRYNRVQIPFKNAQL